MRVMSFALEFFVAVRPAGAPLVMRSLAPLDALCVAAVVAISYSVSRGARRAAKIKPSEYLCLRSRTGRDVKRAGERAIQTRAGIPRPMTASV
jgi:hypothetical protein